MNFDFHELYDYHHVMNLKLAEQLVVNGDQVPETANKLFSHILGAQNIWNSRILKTTATVPVWEIQPCELYQRIENANHADTLKILETKSFDEPLDYVNLQGLKFTNKIGDILYHVANHGNYHRAQIATALKNARIQPLVTDYIAFKRMPL